MHSKEYQLISSILNALDEYISSHESEEEEQKEPVPGSVVKCSDCGIRWYGIAGVWVSEDNLEFTKTWKDLIRNVDKCGTFEVEWSPNDDD